MFMRDWAPNEAQQEHITRMEADRRYEDAMQIAFEIPDFDQSLSLADAFILHALGVEVALFQEMAWQQEVA